MNGLDAHPDAAGEAPSPTGWTAFLPVLLAGVWLVYLGGPLERAVSAPAGTWRAVGVVAIVAFAAAYVSVFVRMRHLGWAALSSTSAHQAFRTDRISAVLVAVMVTSFAAMVPSAGASSLVAVVYIVATVMMLAPLRFGWTVSLLALAATEAAALAVPGWSHGQGAGLAIFLASVAVLGLRLAVRRSEQLTMARDDLARLAVQEERNRFARDLHDILGHSLTVMAMKAELAGRLVQIDAGTAEREIAEVEQLAREALAEVRAAVTGYRGITLAGELANARAALRSAGIEADLPAAVVDVPRERRALFGWVVREGVTNVVRHSGARHCTVTVTATTVEIRDDGRGRPSSPGSEASGLLPGHGLVGLEERTRALSGHLETRSTGDGFVLRVELPHAPSPGLLTSARP